MHIRVYYRNRNQVFSLPGYLFNIIDISTKFQIYRIRSLKTAFCIIPPQRLFLVVDSQYPFLVEHLIRKKFTRMNDSIYRFFCITIDKDIEDLYANTRLDSALEMKKLSRSLFVRPLLHSFRANNTRQLIVFCIAESKHLI